MGFHNSKLFGDIGVWAMNIISSVGIIMANKAIMSSYGFRFVTSLTALHFSATGIVGRASQALGYTTPKPMPFWEVVMFVAVANISIVSMNISLMHNSVGFYQISKLSMVPVVCVMEWIMHSKTYSKEVKAAVVVVVLGVGVCTVTDVHVNLKGFLAALVAVLSSSLQQIFIGSLQKKYAMTAADLLSKTAPLQAATLLLLGPFTDYVLTGSNVLKYEATWAAIGFIVLSCIFAVFCNLSQYMCIGRFSSVTFQVMGHMKTVLILFLGWMLFDSVLTGKNLMGMLMAILGMVIYSFASETTKVTPIVPVFYKEEDIALLKSEVHTIEVTELDRESTKL